MRRSFSVDPPSNALFWNNTPHTAVNHLDFALSFWQAAFFKRLHCKCVSCSHSPWMLQTHKQWSVLVLFKSPQKRHTVYLWFLFQEIEILQKIYAYLDLIRWCKLRFIGQASRGWFISYNVKKVSHWAAPECAIDETTTSHFAMTSSRRPSKPQVPKWDKILLHHLPAFTYSRNVYFSYFPLV